MGILDSLFGGKKKKEEEKIERENYINKLIDYEDYIGNYEELISQLSATSLEIIKSNVDSIIKRFEFENELKVKYGNELGKKIYTDEVFLGMSEEQFDDHMKYKVIIGQEKIYDHLVGGITKPYSIRRESNNSNKIKILRTNTTATKNPSRVDFIFIDNKLYQIKKFK